MFLRLADNRDPDSLATRMRRRRMRWFGELLKRYPEPVRVIDVGGSADFWVATRPQLPRRIQLTLFNIAAASEPLAGVDFLVGDARQMSAIATAAYHVCFSNSVIEHVGSLDDQRAMAHEVQRVGQSYFVQTPYKYFPIEAHYHVPGWQFLPLPVRARLHQRFDLGWEKRQPDLELARSEVASIRLLDVREYRQLFPQAQIRCEWVGPLLKSLTAIGPAVVVL